MNVRLEPRGEGEGGELIDPHCAKWPQYQTALPIGLSTLINQLCSQPSFEASWCCEWEELNTESQADQSAQSKRLQSVQPQTDI